MNQDIRNRKYAFIIDNLTADKTILVQTALKITSYNKKHINMFRLSDKGIFVQRGKKWDCIDYCKIIAQG